MEQRTLNLFGEQENRPALDPQLREELIPLMAAAIVAVDEARQGENHDGRS